MSRNTPEAGGETAFPCAQACELFLRRAQRPGLAVTPRSGTMLFFRNTLPDGRLDPASLHESRPVIKVRTYVMCLRAVVNISAGHGCCAVLGTIPVGVTLRRQQFPLWRRGRSGQQQCGFTPSPGRAPVGITNRQHVWHCCVFTTLLAGWFDLPCDTSRSSEDFLAVKASMRNCTQYVPRLLPNVKSVLEADSHCLLPSLQQPAELSLCFRPLCALCYDDGLGLHQPLPFFSLMHANCGAVTQQVSARAHKTLPRTPAELHSTHRLQARFATVPAYMCLLKNATKLLSDSAFASCRCLSCEAACAASPQALRWAGHY